MGKEFDWIKFATEKFYLYRGESNRWAKENKDVLELALINAGKAAALSELLEAAGHKPE